MSELSQAEGVTYITNQLINGRLIMADATKETGWSFPRIRSRAITICKHLGGTFTKVERGVYECVTSAAVSSEVLAVVRPGTQLGESEIVDTPLEEDTITIADAEQALLGNTAEEGSENG